MMDQQFQKYETDVGAYRDYLSNVVKTRDEARNTGNLDNAANREQKEIIDSVAQVQSVIDQYASLVSNNHLIDQIKSYDATIKEYDAHYVDQDTQVITALASKNAQDDHLSVDELKQVFSQQIRKIMSKQVKDMDITKSEEFLIFKFEDRESTEPVMFGQSICLMTPDGYFIGFKSIGELRVEKN